MRRASSVRFTWGIQRFASCDSHDFEYAIARMTALLNFPRFEKLIFKVKPILYNFISIIQMNVLSLVLKIN